MTRSLEYDSSYGTNEDHCNWRLAAALIAFDIDWELVEGIQREAGECGATATQGVNYSRNYWGRNCRVWSELGSVEEREWNIVVPSARNADLRPLSGVLQEDETRSKNPWKILFRWMCSSIFICLLDAADSNNQALSEEKEDHGMPVSLICINFIQVQANSTHEEHPIHSAKAYRCHG